MDSTPPIEIHDELNTSYMNYLEMWRRCQMSHTEIRCEQKIYLVEGVLEKSVAPLLGVPASRRIE